MGLATKSPVFSNRKREISIVFCTMYFSMKWGKITRNTQTLQCLQTVCFAIIYYLIFFTPCGTRCEEDADAENKIDLLIIT